MLQLVMFELSRAITIPYTICRARAFGGLHSLSGCISNPVTSLSPDCSSLKYAIFIAQFSPVLRLSRLAVQFYVMRIVILMDY